jgi:hypothetical protein
MEPTTLALAALIWHGATEITTGRALLGPWQMNESRWDYVDDPSVALDERGGAAVVWVDQGRKDVFFQRFSVDGRPLGKPFNASRSPKIFSWLPRVALQGEKVFILWQEIIFSGGSHGGDILFARSEDGGKTFAEPLNLSDSVAGDGKGRFNAELWHNGSLDLVVSGNGVYAAWTEYEGALWLRRSLDGGKSFLPKTKMNETKPARAPSLAVQGNTVYLAWTVGDDEAADIRVARSKDGGASFAAPLIVERSRGYSDAPKLALDARGCASSTRARTTAARASSGRAISRARGPDFRRSVSTRRATSACSGSASSARRPGRAGWASRSPATAAGPSRPLRCPRAPARAGTGACRACS